MCEAALSRLYEKLAEGMTNNTNNTLLLDRAAMDVVGKEKTPRLGRQKIAQAQKHIVNTRMGMEADNLTVKIQLFKR